MIYALHGFLGLSSDWAFLKKHFSSSPQFQVQAQDLWQDSNITSMKEWAEKKSHDIEQMPHPRILLGYSMGGRLAMHLLLAQPRAWDAAIFVSANPGIADVQERSARSAIDKKWAQKFLKEDWNKVTTEWNQQKLFATKSPHALELPRLEKDFKREALAKVLENWSVSRQEDLALKLSQITLPVLWLAGENDEKYCDLLSGFAQVAPSHKFAKISQASHRAPWDHPEEFISKLENFIAMVKPA